MEASCVFFRGITSHGNGSLQKPLNPLRPLIFPAPSASYVLDAVNHITSHSLTSASRFRRSSTATTTTCSATNANRRSGGKYKRGADADGDDGSAALQNAVTGGGHTQVATLISTAGSGATSSGDSPRSQAQGSRRKQRESCAPGNVRALYQNGDPLGRRDLGKCVIKWICQGMRAMASDFTLAEMQGEFTELKQRMGPGLTFVIQAQPYLNAVPMPLGFEAICLKVCTHYPTLFDHFQRELRDLLQDLQRKLLVQDWRETESWQLLKELANSAQHRAIARKSSQPKIVPGVLGLDLDKVKAIQSRIDDFTKRMSDLLLIERDAELEFTQEELNAVPMPEESSDSAKPIEFLVSHSQAEQELCDTICNLNAVSTSTGHSRSLFNESLC